MPANGYAITFTSTIGEVRQISIMRADHPQIFANDHHRSWALRIAQQEMSLNQRFKIENIRITEI